MKKKYVGQLAIITGDFEGDFGDLVAHLGAHPDIRFIPSSAKARISTMGSNAFSNRYGSAIRADERRVMRAERPTAIQRTNEGSVGREGGS